MVDEAAKSELEQLQHELQLLKSSLLNVDTSQDERAAALVRHIRQLVYEAEDSIDSYCFMQATAQPPGRMDIFRRCLRRRRGLGEAKDLSSFRKGRLTATIRKARIAIDKMQSGGGAGISAVEKLLTMEKEGPSIKLNKIVGFEDEEETLVGYLKEEKGELDVISIIGMPGLGKTTLAWKIYQNKDIQYEFPTRIWVYVSQEFNMRNVLLNILKEFTMQDNSTMSDQELAHIVHELLRSRKFLLVLDDVWTVEAWDCLKVVLPQNNNMGKVLITSRLNNVGRYANVTRQPHKLRFLTEEESWELLQLEVFGELDHCPEELMSISKCIAKQCGGLPLSIVMVGSILVVGSSTGAAIGLTRQWWEKVSGNLTTYMQDYNQHPMLGILEMSYNKLPVQLRDCFLYLGVFPEDYEIPVRTLTHLWIAEGFIQGNGRQSLEDKAVENLYELIRSNLVIVAKTNLFGELKTCRVHDMIHGFCKSKAAEHNFFQEIKMSEEGVIATSMSVAPNYRRLCIHSNLSAFLSSKPYGQGVRSFLCFYKEPIHLDPRLNSAICDSFNLLKVLESNSIKYSRFPWKLTKLLHLKYISLSCDDLVALPETISNLGNLQTLVVNTRSHSLVMKANIWRMIQLRHLITKAAIILDRQGKGEAGKNLLTLSRLSPEYCTVDLFRRAPNLKELGIRGKLATLLETDSLRNLDHLENLKLVNDSHYELASENPLHHLHPNCFPPNLKRLTISATYLSWEHMSVLGKIRTLKSLKLKNNAFTGLFWNTDVDGFGCLEFLLIENADLVSWEVSADCFPRLNCLALRNCESLREIPLSLAKSLQVLDVQRVSSSVVESAKEIQKEKEWMQRKEKVRLPEFKLSIGPGRE